MLILASASPRRRELLREAGLRFKVVPSGVREDNTGKDPRRLVRGLALAKARAVARRHPGAWVLGADTLVWCRGEALGKPAGAADALRMLRLLNGAWQRVYTGVALVRGGDGRELSGVEVSRVKARKMPEDWLRRFSLKHHDKAGAYAIQDEDDPFIERLIGPFDNVVGLPVALTRRLLDQASKLDT